MLGIWKQSVAIALGLGLAIFCTPIWAAPPVAQPGALNYVEGQLSIGNQAVTSRAVGSAILNTGDVLSTGNGRAELLLTPGVFMRLGKNSAVRMESPELTNTRVELLQGEATVEADVLHPEDRILIVERGATTQLTKEGVYDFNADLQVVRVYEGKATVTQGDLHVDLKKDRQVALNQPLKSTKFDRDAVENSDPLYAWSKLRSEYLSDATASTAQTYLVDGGPWYGAGWYWNPYWAMYSFIPGGGFFYNPFGFGLYSPLYAGFYGGHFYGGGHGFYGRGYARGSIARSAPLAMHAAPMMGGGGFHGGGGGHR
jgi:hypothetical protein